MGMEKFLEETKASAVLALVLSSMPPSSKIFLCKGAMVPLALRALFQLPMERVPPGAL